MKKNITINLCGRLFQIDEDAYELLQQYIESLRSSFGKQEGGDEIVDDIEARIAELFDELRQQGIEAITIDHVKDIISRIGKPEELTGEEQTADDNSGGHRYDSFCSAAQDVMDNVRTRTAGKRLFRNPKDKMLAGVCSGFAVYTNTDPVVWRLLAVLLVLFYGVGIITYIVLAIVLPEAKTPEQLLQMEGKDVTPQNLADVMVDNDKQPAQRPSLIRNLFSFILKILFGFFVIIAMIVCVALCIGFLFALVVLVSALAFPISSNLPFSLEAMGLAELYQTNPFVLTLFAISLFLLLLIPIYAIIHMVLSLAGKTQPMGIMQRIAWGILWIIALCCIVPCGITMAGYNQEYYNLQNHEQHHIAEYTLNDVPMVERDYNFFTENDWTMLKHSNTQMHYITLTASGEYYTGDSNVFYLDGHVENGHLLIYQAEHKEKIEPGIYSLNCIARAEGKGAFIYIDGDNKLLKEIPPYGNEGGELWAGIHLLPPSETRGSIEETHKKIEEMLKDEPLWKQQEWKKITAANNGKGYGWSVIQIDNIVVKGDSIVYGVSTIPSFTGQPCHVEWFSATDFKLTRTADLPKAVKGRK